MSSSWNEPSSSRYSIRSRAVILPLACWRSTACGEPAWRASSLRAFSSPRRSVIGWSMVRARLPEALSGRPHPSGPVRRAYSWTSSMRVPKPPSGARTPPSSPAIRAAGTSSMTVPPAVLHRLRAARAVRHPVADVVHPLALRSRNLATGESARRRREQLDVGVGHLDQGLLHPVGLDRFAVGDIAPNVCGSTRRRRRGRARRWRRGRSRSPWHRTPPRREPRSRPVPPEQR